MPRTHNQGLLHVHGGARRMNFVGAAGGGETTLDEDLPTPTLERLTAADEYPPELRVVPGVDSEVGDSIELWTDDEYTFAAPRTDENSVVIDAGIYAAQEADFNLASILAGSYYFQARIVRGAFHGPWSNIVNVGDTTEPAMTSANSFNSTENASTNFALAADEGATFAVVGGTFAADASIVGSTLTLAAQNREVDGTSGTIIIRPTDYAGNVGADQTITVTVIDVDEQPNAYSFTDTTDATTSTVYNSLITIAGLGAGEVVSGTFSGDGTYKKNGGAAVTTSPFTATNGDTFDSYLTSSGSAATLVSNTFSIGEPAVNDTHSVTTAASLPLAAEWDLIVDPSDLTKLYTAITQTGGSPAVHGDLIGYVDDASPNGFDMNAAAASAVRPTLALDGSIKSIRFDNTNSTYLKGAAGTALGAWAAAGVTGCAFVLALKYDPATMPDQSTFWGSGLSTDNDNAFTFIEAGGTTGGMTGLWRKADSTLITMSSSALLNGSSIDSNYRVIVVNVSTTDVKTYVDGVLSTTRTYTWAAIPFDRFSIGAWLRGAASGHGKFDMQFFGYIPRVLTTGVGAEVAQITSYAALKQGRPI